MRLGFPTPGASPRGLHRRALGGGEAGAGHVEARWRYLGPLLVRSWVLHAWSWSGVFALFMALVWLFMVLACLSLWRAGLVLSWGFSSLRLWRRTPRVRRG
jgi:hypothetical protein